MQAGLQAVLHPQPSCPLGACFLWAGMCELESSGLPPVPLAAGWGAGVDAAGASLAARASGWWGDAGGSEQRSRAAG